MKKYILLLAAALIAAASAAQPHLAFKGIPITGDEETFVKTLTDLGYNAHADQGPGLKIVSGVFAGLDANIFIRSTEMTGTVSGVNAVFGQQTDWDELKIRYDIFKKSLTKKYGTPKSSEEFTFPYRQGDGKELTAVRNGKCKWISIFEAVGQNKELLGTITLKIQPVGNAAAVSIDYEDALGAKIWDAEKMSIIESDL